MFQERIYSVIEKEIKSSGKVVQKRNKGNSLRFQLLPLRENSSQSENDLNSDNRNENKGPLWLVTGLLIIFVAKYVILRKYLVKSKTDIAPEKELKKSESPDSVWLLKYYSNSSE